MFGPVSLGEFLTTSRPTPSVSKSTDDLLVALRLWDRVTMNKLGFHGDVGKTW